MPPKSSQPPSTSKGVSKPSSSNSAANKAIAAPSKALQSTYQFLTAQENRSVVWAVGGFGIAVGFLSSSWSDLLVPGYRKQQTADDTALSEPEPTCTTKF
ncbi:MAG: hypothetical protein L6R40_000461 [Gallowayella cf. fulva]|nr:MAG: hypothetical protein L6R40_000461 [Xanthomendoza cf. fulva]